MLEQAWWDILAVGRAQWRWTATMCGKVDCEAHGQWDAKHRGAWEGASGSTAMRGCHWQGVGWSVVSCVLPFNGCINVS